MGGGGLRIKLSGTGTYISSGRSLKIMAVGPAKPCRLDRVQGRSPTIYRLGKKRKLGGLKYLSSAFAKDDATRFRA